MQGNGRSLPQAHACRENPGRSGPTPAHICTGTGLIPPTSAPGLGPPHPHLHRDWAHPIHICTRTGPTHPHLHQDWAHPAHICTGTAPTPPTSALRPTGLRGTACADRRGFVDRGARGVGDVVQPQREPDRSCAWDRGGPSPGADVGKGGPSPGADVGGVRLVPAQMWEG